MWVTLAEALLLPKALLWIRNVWALTTVVAHKCRVHRRKGWSWLLHACHFELHIDPTIIVHFLVYMHINRDANRKLVCSICNTVRMPCIGPMGHSCSPEKHAGHSIMRCRTTAVLCVAHWCWLSSFSMEGVTVSLSFNYQNYSEHTMDTCTTDLYFYCSNPPHTFNNVTLILHIGLTWIHLHICVWEKCY